MREIKQCFANVYLFFTLSVGYSHTVLFGNAHFEKHKYYSHQALDRICEEYNRVIGNMEVEPLIVIPIFIHDFLCIHPFNDENWNFNVPPKIFF